MKGFTRNLTLFFSFSLLWLNSYAAQPNDHFYTFPVPAARQANQADFLMTPRASMEFFLEQAKENNFDKAAAALHMGLMDTHYSQADIAKQLYVLINKQLIFSWDDLSDLPEAPVSIENPQSPQWTRSVKLDSIKLHGRNLSLNLQRFKLPDSEQSVWLFSPQSIQYIPTLYTIYQPSNLEKKIPSWASKRYVYLPLWQWLALPLLFGISYFFAGITQKIIHFFTRFIKKSKLQPYIPQIQRPLVVLLTVLYLNLLVSLVFSLAGPILTLMQTAYTVAIIMTLFWSFLRCFNLYVDNLQYRYILDENGDKKELDTLEDTEQKSQLTHISVLRRTVIFFAVIITIYSLLINFDLFDGFGSTLLTSVGVFSIIIGIAAQATLGNFIAGLQIVISKPVRIGDALNYNNTWCYCEDITYTYITLKVWDDRRIIVPLKEFIATSFENWTMTDSHLIQPFVLYVDFKIDVSLLREKFEVLMEAHELYDHRFSAAVHTVENTQRSLCVRFLCSAATPLDAWQLHCDMREAMTYFVAHLDEGLYLPRDRQIEIESALRPH